jgi:hypothetical protein
MMLAGSPGRSQISIVMMPGTMNGNSTAATRRTIGLSHHLCTECPPQTLMTTDQLL